jgi:DNA primase
LARYTDDSKQRVRDAVDMIDLVSAKTDLRKAGADRWEGLCPFHEERTPSFGISAADKVYYCFGCQAKGDCFTFVQETEGLEFKAALEFLAERYRIELQLEQEDPREAERRKRRERLLELTERTATYYVRVLWQSDEGAAAREYLAARGLEEATLRRFRVGVSPGGWDRVVAASRKNGYSEAELIAAGLAQRSRNGGVIDRFRGRIMFPLADRRGRVLGFGARALAPDDKPKYLNTSEGELYHKGAQLFGADLARAPAAKAGSVVVVEGYTDVLALHQAGIEQAVAIMGTALTEEQVTALGQMAPRVLLCLDADTAGQEAMLRAQRLAAGKGVELRVVPLPPGADPAELVAEEGAGAVKQLLSEAVSFPEFRVRRALEAGDLGTPEGRDVVLRDVAQALDIVPPGVVREELSRVVASQLGVSPDLVADMVARAQRNGPGPISKTGGGLASASGGGSVEVVEPPRRAAAATVLDRREEAQRAFLALCIAQPEAGAMELEALDPERHFTSPLVRRAVAHVRPRLATPMADLPGEDTELVELVGELVVRAGQVADRRTLRIAALGLEKAALEREMGAAKTSGHGVSEIAGKRDAVIRQMREAWG